MAATVAHREAPMPDDETPSCAELDERLRPVPKTWRRKVMEKASLVILAVAMLLVGAIGVTAYERATRWDPLGDYPVQVAYAVVDGVRQPAVKSPVPGNGSSAAAVVLPTFYLDDKINTTGIKCTNTTDEITVTGALSWVSDVPPGRIIEVARGGGPRGPGCITYEFANPIPPQILDVLNDLAADGIMESEWHLTGTETPVKADGTEGEQRVWTTTVFRIVHMERP